MSEYLLDRKLIPRLRELLDGLGRTSVDAETATEHLQSTYSEYKRKKKNSLQRSVTKALDSMGGGEKRKSGDSTPTSAKVRRAEVVDLDEDSEASDRDVKDSPNLMNASVSKLYANGVKTPKKKPKLSTPKNPFQRPSTEHQFVLETSTKSFADIGGCEPQKLEVCQQLMHLKHPEIYRSLGVSPPCGFLLHGPPGSGKTLFALAVAGELGLPLLRMAATELVSGVSGETEDKMRQLFRKAKESAPCLLFLDEIDAITPKRETAQREMERRIVAQLLACLDELVQPTAEDEELKGHVLVIGATNRPDSLDPALRRAGRFDKEIGLGIPDEAGRARILSVLSRGLRLEPGLSMERLAHLTPGYVGADLGALVREASLAAVSRIFERIASDKQLVGGEAKTESELDKVLGWLKQDQPLPKEALDDLCVNSGDFFAAIKLVSPSAKREGFATVPGVTWDDVGALAAVRDQLKWSILYPVEHSAAFESVGLAGRPQGVLLCGPPGLAQASQALIGPNVVLILVSSSGDWLESSGGARVVNQLLTEMDGMEGRAKVFLMGATNRPDIIDPAVMRPGRLDKIIYVGFPTAEDRVEILAALTKKGTKPRVEALELLETVGRDARLEFFSPMAAPSSGADLGALVHEAAVCGLREHLSLREAAARTPDSTSAMAEHRECVLTLEHFHRALAALKPSVGEVDRKRYLALEKKYGVSDSSNGAKP